MGRGGGRLRAGAGVESTHRPGLAPRRGVDQCRQGREARDLLQPGAAKPMPSRWSCICMPPRCASPEISRAPKQRPGACARRTQRPARPATSWPRCSKAQGLRRRGAGAARDSASGSAEDATALNYLGYMLAERGQRLDEAVALVQRALKLEPGNPSFLDSLGWAYYQQGKFDLADPPLTEAASKLPNNSVIQDHLGDLRFKQRRFSDATAAWQRALNGDGESIDRPAIEKKIIDAKARLENRVHLSVQMPASQPLDAGRHLRRWRRRFPRAHPSASTCPPAPAPLCGSSRPPTRGREGVPRGADDAGNARPVRARRHDDAARQRRCGIRGARPHSPRRTAPARTAGLHPGGRRGALHALHAARGPGAARRGPRVDRRGARGSVARAGRTAVARERLRFRRGRALEGREYTGGYVGRRHRRSDDVSPPRAERLARRRRARPPLTVLYSGFASGRPATLRVASTGTPRADLTVRLSDVNINVPMEAAVFAVDVPGGGATADTRGAPPRGAARRPMTT